MRERDRKEYGTGTPYIAFIIIRHRLERGGDHYRNGSFVISVREWRIRNLGKLHISDIIVGVQIYGGSFVFPWTCWEFYPVM